MVEMDPDPNHAPEGQDLDSDPELAKLCRSDQVLIHNTARNHK